eukprot:scaffold97_cov261-Pinguiococcus_pyrenoidosus.AAC.22
MLPLLGTQYGGYASRVCVDEANIAAAPDTVPLEEMAALPLVACTVRDNLHTDADTQGHERDGALHRLCRPCAQWWRRSRATRRERGASSRAVAEE